MHLCGHPSFDGPDDDAAPEITRLGLEGQCPVCVQTLDLWTSVYGAEAGNLALKVLARGGVWVAGGIAVKIRKKLEDGTFLQGHSVKKKNLARCWPKSPFKWCSMKKRHCSVRCLKRLARLGLRK